MSDSPMATRAVLYTSDQKSGKLKIRRFLLRIVAGPDAGLEKLLGTGTVLIGTDPNNDIVLTDTTISRYHLELQVRASGLRITDQDSTNGTRMGKTRLGTVTVRERAHLKLGGGETQIEIVPDDEDVALTPFAKDFFGEVYGVSPPMVRVFQLLDRVAATDTTVLLEGQTGTGKELLARAVHEHSPRAQKPYIVVDCASLPADLIGSELFGHIKGSFTGAVADRKGLAEQAQEGTLFFDEIGELPLELQPQLLRLLEQREIRPVGSARPRAVDVRVVAATNRDLQSMVGQGTFREDLYFRLAVIKVDIPPLRDRRDDIPGLVRHFLHGLGQGDFELPEETMRQLLAHDWPGNVRELRNTIERGMALATMQIGIDGGGRPRPPTAAPPGLDEQPVSSEMMEMPFKEAKGLLIEAFEREYLVQLLDRHRGNISRAAQEAGIDRNYIHRLVNKYKIPVERG